MNILNIVLMTVEPEGGNSLGTFLSILFFIGIIILIVTLFKRKRGGSL